MWRLGVLILLLLCVDLQAHCVPPEAGGGFTPPATVLTMLHVNQFGYTPGMEKVLVAADPITGYNSAQSYTPPATLELRRATDGVVVHSGSPVAWNSGAEHVQSGDKVWWYDFSSVTAVGTYYVYDPVAQARSDIFLISTTPYHEVLRQAVRTFFYQRSGFAKAVPFADVRWADGVSFLRANQDPGARLVSDQSNASTARDLQGGWFDAGDYNKYTIFATYAVTDLLHAYLTQPSLWTDDYNIPESGNGIPDLLDEIKWELDWLLRMQQATGNGSVLSKVSLVGFGHSSPPSTDTNARFYGAASTASTACSAAVFALAAQVFSGIPSLATYATTTLQPAAVNAWTWSNSNTNVRYDNAGFSSAAPEPYDPGSTPAFAQSDYQKLMCRLQAAVYLYALTGTAAYKTFVEANYTAAVPISSTTSHPFRPDTAVSSALLYYTIQPGITGSVKTAIETAKTTAIQNYPMYDVGIAEDAYRAPLRGGEYVWGSNEIKANLAVFVLEQLRYNLNSANATAYRNTAAGYIHYLLGVNPNSLAFFTNLYAMGCKRCANEIWHSWFFHNTQWENALTSTSGPAPGYVPGGPNEWFQQAAPIPPAGQPRQKQWLDDNFDDNGNRWIWEINEPAIYYQAAVVRALAYFVAHP